MSGLHTAEETNEILNRFYEDCVKFWGKEINERGYETDFTVEVLAVKDIEAISTNPFSPQGDALDVETHKQWISKKYAELNVKPN